MNIFKIFLPKYYKTYYIEKLDVNAIIYVKLGFDDKYYVEIKDNVLDMIFRAGNKTFTNLTNAINFIIEYKNEVFP